MCGVSTPLDLEAARGVTATRQPGLRQAVRGSNGQALCATGRYRKSDFNGVRSVLDVDERITAPSFGLARPRTITGLNPRWVRVQRARATLLIQAKDDPLRRSMRSNPGRWSPIHTFGCWRPNMAATWASSGAPVAASGERAILHWITEQLL